MSKRSRAARHVQHLRPVPALVQAHAARLQFEEDEKGTLGPGKRADLVVLSANPLAVAPDGIAGIRVLRTITGGRVVYDDGGDVA